MNLFVYGTLLVPKILEAVTRRNDFKTIPATLTGYEIRRVNGGDFPGIVKGSTQVCGKVLLEVPEVAMSRLDCYEDSFYRRELVDVTTASGIVEAFAYIVPIDVAATVLSDQIWTLQWFEEEALDRYWERLFQ